MGGTGKHSRFALTRVRSRTVKPLVGPAPDPARCLVVEKVAPASIAAAAGIKMGDRIVSIDGTPAADRTPGAIMGTDWEIFVPGTKELIQLVTMGGELGIEAWRTGEAMDAREPVSARELEVLWKRADWERLERLAQSRLEAKKRDDPALALLGAALVERGRAAEGEAMVEEFARDFTAHWPLCYTAIALYYRGCAALRSDARAAGVTLLETAYRHEPYDRITVALGKATGRRPPAVVPRWEGQTFPVSYDLARLDGSEGRVRLAAELAALTPDQVLVVCVMAEQRGNATYNDFMQRYRAFAADLRPFVRGLHVLTSTQKRDPDRPDFFTGEDAVRAAGLPFTLLEDTNTAVANALQPKGAPEIYVLDRDRRVVHQGMLESVELWTALAKLEGDGPKATDASPARSSLLRWVAIALVIAIVGIGFVLRRRAARSGDAPSPRYALEQSEEVLVRVSPTSLRTFQKARSQAVGPLAEGDVPVEYWVTTASQSTDAGITQVEWLTVGTTDEALGYGTVYRPMSTTQLFDLAEKRPRCAGIIVDGTKFTLADVVEMDGLLPRKPPVPFEIREAARQPKR